VHPPVTSSHLGPNILLSTPYSNTLNLCKISGFHNDPYTYLDVLHDLAWTRNALWARPCLSVCLSVAFFSLGTRQPPELLQGAKRTQGFAPEGSSPRELPP
jgi:hypothetical protein